jgi:hypothetical protein
VARSSGGRGDFSREVRFDDAAGTVSVDDSDIFVDGKEVSAPRITRATKPLSPAAHAALVRNLVAICPDEAAFKLECAPGGCSDLAVTFSGGQAHMHDYVTVSRVLGLIEPFFPELRDESAVNASGDYDVVLADATLGTVHLTSTAEMTVTSVVGDHAAWLGALADKTNRTVTLPATEGAAGGVVQRTEAAFLSSMKDELRRDYGVEMRKR